MLMLSKKLQGTGAASLRSRLQDEQDDDFIQHTVPALFTQFRQAPAVYACLAGVFGRLGMLN